jgi:hypothetical protein
MFQNGGGGLTVDNQTTGRTSETVKIIDDAELRGRWHDIMVHARWSRDDDGLFDVFVNGDRRYQHEGPTMTADAVCFKFGVYRSFISRNRGVAAATTQVAYYDAVRHGRTRADVDIETAPAGK